jgi:PAS domain S-box-containing protein
MWLWEGRVITGPNEYKWVHGASRPQLQENDDIIWDGVSMNITSRKEEELKLQASEERFNAFMDNSPAIAFMKDEAGRYVYVNRPFKQRFHLSREQWFNKTDAELWPDAATALREHDLRVLSSQTTVEIEDTLDTPDGSVEYWRGYKFTVVDATGHLVGGSSVSRSRPRSLSFQARVTQPCHTRDADASRFAELSTHS